MRRKILNFTAGVSIVIGMATVALQLRACWTWESLTRSNSWVDSTGYHAWGLSASSQVGGVSIDFYSWDDRKVRPGDEKRWSYDYGYSLGEGREWRTWPAPAFSGTRSWSGWRGRNERAIDTSDVMVGVPYWFAAVVTIAPAIAWLYRNRLRRTQVGKLVCMTCGYDLRATPNRCPECGTMGNAGARPPAE